MSFFEKIAEDAKDNKRKLIVAGVFTVAFSLGFLDDCKDLH